MNRLLPIVLCLCLVLSARSQQHHADGLDDVLQHVPMTSVFVLKACGAESTSAWPAMALTAIASYGLAAATTYGLKHAVGELRPDKSDRRAFPSGHATFAFAGATMLCHEFGNLSPWIAVGGYTLATLTAIDRVRLDRHYLHDVCAGAAVGFAATELTYLLKKKLFRSENVDLAFTGQSIELAIRW